MRWHGSARMGADMRGVAVAAVMLSLPGTALAQARDCRVPAVLPRPVVEGATASQPRRDVPIGGYTLALSWSPEYCRTRLSNTADRFQCGGPARFGFTQHGLWPD